ncbi:hypothetical protein VTK26DRAFT_6056 [Humicola hyalothermophila]
MGTRTGTDQSCHQQGTKKGGKEEKHNNMNKQKKKEKRNRIKSVVLSGGCQSSSQRQTGLWDISQVSVILLTCSNSAVYLGFQPSSSSQVFSFDAIALLVPLLLPPLVSGYDYPLDTVSLLNFLGRHTMAWPTDFLERWSTQHGWQAICCQVHLRSLTCDGSNFPSSLLKNVSGIIMERQSIAFDVPGRAGKRRLTEQRFSIALTCLPLTGGLYGRFAVVCLSDVQIPSPGVWRSPSGIVRVPDDGTLGGPHFCHTFSGIAMFQQQLYNTIRQWSRDWKHTLSYLDGVIRVQVGQT